MNHPKPASQHMSTLRDTVESTLSNPAAAMAESISLSAGPGSATCRDAAFAPSGLEARRTWVRAFRKSLAGRLDELLALIVEETGKPRQEALFADALPLLAACRWHERHLRRLLRPASSAGWLRAGPLWLPGVRVQTLREPVGRVAIIATWNYPVQLLGVQLLQAIAAGNQVVVKPSEVVPRTQGLLLEIASAALAGAGLPRETLTWTPATREAGRALLQSGSFDHVLFTGSTRIGRAIAEVAAPSLTPTTLELSGSDSAIVLDDADVRLAARGLWSAVVMNAGQTCMAPRRILVEKRVHAAFVAALVPLAAAARPLRLVDAAAAELAYDAARRAVDAGGRSASAVLEPNAGPWLRPLAILDAPREGPLFEGAHFGPVVAVCCVRDEEEALRLHLRQPRRLTLALFTRRRARAARVVAKAGVTTVTINDCVRPVGHPAAMIGGRGESGWGVSRGAEGLLSLTRPVVVCTAHRWLRAPVDPPAGRRLGLVERALRWLHGGRGDSFRPLASPAPQQPPRQGEGPSI
jgi:aldehyde dehydrogenase (NAD+)